MSHKTTAGCRPTPPRGQQPCCLTMISTLAALSSVASGKRARARRLPQAVTMMADATRANSKNSVHHSQRKAREHTATSVPAAGRPNSRAAPAAAAGLVDWVSDVRVLEVSEQTLLGWQGRSREAASVCACLRPQARHQHTAACCSALACCCSPVDGAQAAQGNHPGRKGEQQQDAGADAQLGAAGHGVCGACSGRAGVAGPVSACLHQVESVSCPSAGGRGLSRKVNGLAVQTQQPWRPAGLRKFVNSAPEL